MRIQEHGLQQRENLRFFPTKPKCVGGGSNFVSASLIDTGPAILIFLWGMLVTVVVLGCEFIFSRCSCIGQKISAFELWRTEPNKF